MWRAREVGYMTKDIDRIIDDATEAIKDVVKEDWPGIKDYATQVLQNKKEAIQEFAKALASGEITNEEFESAMAGEKKTLEAELVAPTVMTKAMAQKAANAAAKTIVRAVQGIGGGR